MMGEQRLFFGICLQNHFAKHHLHSVSIALPSVNLFFPQLSTEEIFQSTLLIFCEIKATQQNHDKYWKCWFDEQEDH